MLAPLVDLELAEIQADLGDLGCRVPLEGGRSLARLAADLVQWLTPPSRVRAVAPDAVVLERLCRALGRLSALPGASSSAESLLSIVSAADRTWRLRADELVAATTSSDGVLIGAVDLGQASGSPGRSLGTQWVDGPACPHWLVNPRYPADIRWYDDLHAEVIVRLQEGAAIQLVTRPKDLAVVLLEDHAPYRCVNAGALVAAGFDAAFATARIPLTRDDAFPFELVAEVVEVRRWKTIATEDRDLRKAQHLVRSGLLAARRGDSRHAAARLIRTGAESYESSGESDLAANARSLAEAIEAGRPLAPSLAEEVDLRQWMRAVRGGGADDEGANLKAAPDAGASTPPASRWPADRGRGRSRYLTAAADARGARGRRITQGTLLGAIATVGLARRAVTD